MQPARFYGRGEGDAVDCFLCAHRCRIREGAHGVCGVRQNRGGRLYSLVYGRVVASHVDPIEKKPLYHFLPGSTAFSIATVGCNFRCRFCQNCDISQAPRAGRILGNKAGPQGVVDAAVAGGCASISYTYTEPTVFMTNGYQSEEAVAAMAGLVDAANVDLKAFEDAFYRTYCGARLQPVLESIRNMHAAGIRLEVTTLVIPGLNDTPEQLRGIAEFLCGLSPDVPWHVSRFHPQFEMLDVPPTPAETIFRAVSIAEEVGLRYVYAGNLPAGKYGDTRCPFCGATVIARSGFGVRGVQLRGNACGGCGKSLPIVVP
jgi:pyruvate formate lyase activating enzyme